ADQPAEGSSGLRRAGETNRLIASDRLSLFTVRDGGGRSCDRPPVVLLMAHVELAQLTDCGPVRENNEDAIGSWPCDDGIVFAVGDGLGGRGGGEIASRLALEILESGLNGSPDKWPVAKKLRRVIQDANLRIYNMGMAVPELRGMGTTLTATAVVGASLV